MRRNKFITSIFVTDETIGIYCHNKVDIIDSISINIKLEDNIIENGYIINPLLLLEKFEEAFKTMKFVPRNLNFVFLGENIIIREISVKKKDLVKDNIDEYIKKQIGKTLMVPFKEASYTYNIKSDSTEEIKAVIFITDKDLLDDYYDVLEKVGVRNINTSLLSTNIDFLFNESKENIGRTTIIASVLNQNITVHIMEDNSLVFGINHECEMIKNGTCDMISEFIERIANYYQFNLRKGEREVDNVVLLNFSERMSNNAIKNTIDFEYESIVLNITDINSNLLWDDKYSNVASIASLGKIKGFEKNLEFDLKRTKKYNIFASYLLILTLFIFSLVSLIYIPLVNYYRDVQELENINSNLLIQQQMLEDNISNNSSVSSYVRNYNYAFNKLTELSVSKTRYITDILEEENANIEIMNVSFDDIEKSIVITLTSANQAYLYDFSISLYENHGDDGSATINKWILYAPEIVISNNTMEVTIYYA